MREQEQEQGTQEQGEILRLHRFELDGLAMVDIRYWKDTKNGPRPTKKGVPIQQYLVTPLISALQNMHASYSREESKKKTAA